MRRAAIPGVWRRAEDPARRDALPSTLVSGARCTSSIPGRLFLCWAGLVLLAAGCASSEKRSEPGAAETFAPMPPAFLTGPAAVLLTNAGGFSAHLVLSTGSASPLQTGVSGELLSRAGTLLFAPEPGKTDRKYSRGGFIFIWDVATGRGFVLSEALQGYAPVTMSTTPTNLITSAGGGSSEKVAGHACEAEEALVQMSDGSHATFRVLRAADLTRVPVRISSVSNAAPFALSFTKIRIEAPAADLFAPPKDFTRYESPEVMMAELLMRHQNLKRVRTSEAEPSYDYRQRR